MVNRILEGGDDCATRPWLERPHLQRNDAPIGLDGGVAYHELLPYAQKRWVDRQIS